MRHDPVLEASVELFAAAKHADCEFWAEGVSSKAYHHRSVIQCLKAAAAIYGLTITGTGDAEADRVAHEKRVLGEDENIGFR